MLKWIWRSLEKFFQRFGFFRKLQVKGLLWKGQNQLDREQYQAGLESFKQAVKLERRNPQLLYWLGLAYSLLENYEQSIEYLSHALDIDPSYNLARARRGMAYEELNRIEQGITYKKPKLAKRKTLEQEKSPKAQAKADFREVRRSEPKTDEDWMGQGIVLAELEKYQEAITKFEEAIKLQPNSHRAYYHLGITWTNLDESEKAVASYKKAIDIKPDYVSVWRRYSLALAYLGDAENAITNCEKAIKLNPNSHKVWRDYGRVLAHLGYNDKTYNEKALKKFDQAIELKYNYPEAWRDRGLALANLNRNDEAITNYDEAIKLRPNFPEAYHSRGMTLFRLGRNENSRTKKAIKSFDRAIQLKPDYPEAYYQCGLALVNLGCFEEAIASYEKALEHKPDYREAWQKHGDALFKLVESGEHEVVIDICNNAVKIESNEQKHWHYHLCGNAQQQLSRSLDACASYDQAITTKPDYYEAWNGRGNAKRDLGDYKEAITSYEKALNLVPGDKCYWLPWRNWGQTLLRLSKHGEASKIWRKGLEALQDGTTKSHLEGRAELHRCMGKDRQDREFWSFAIKSYEAALENYEALLQVHKNQQSPEQVLETALEVLQDLIIVCQYSTRMRQEDVQPFLDKAEFMLEKLLENTPSPDKQHLLEGKFVGIRQFRVDALAQSPEPEKQVVALETAETRKNVCLRWLREGSWSRAKDTDRCKYSEIKKLLNSQTAAIYWHVSPAAITTFILRRNDEYPIILSAQKTRRNYPPAVCQVKDFEDWMADWKQDYQNYRKAKPETIQTESAATDLSISPDWKDKMPATLETLSNKILNIPGILPHLSGIDQLILIPHGDLHLLPLHALFPQNFTITYLPSAKVGRSIAEQPTRAPLAQDRQDAHPKKLLLSVEHPNSIGFDPLHFAVIESAAITEMFSATRWAGNEATKKNVKGALKQPHDYFHFTGHSEYEFKNPALSYLALTGKQKLTLEDLRDLDLSCYRLVSLSACETAITGNQTITIEYVGLASGFLSRGVANVVSTLWLVESAASALVMMQFYHQLKKGKTEASALSKATKWLRNLTARRLARLYEKVITQIDQINEIRQLSADEERIRSTLETERNIVSDMERNHKPFDYHYHWAAFTITGGVCPKM